MKSENSPKSWKLYAAHILEAAAKIRFFTNMEKEKFLNDVLIYDGVLRNLHTLTESASKLPKDVKIQFPHINWERINGFRNIVVHDYVEGIDADKIWYIIQIYLPELEAAMKQLLPEYTVANLNSAK